MKDVKDCDRLLLSRVDEAVLPARVRRVLRESIAFFGACSCFFALTLDFGALLLALVAVPRDSSSLRGLTSRGRSGLGPRRSASFDRFRFQGVKLADTCRCEGAPSFRGMGVVPADAGCTYGG